MDLLIFVYHFVLLIIQSILIPVFPPQTLLSSTYSESELPHLPDCAPGIVCWVLMNCLQRNPTARPPAALVADVLHSWCLLRHSCRRRQRNRVTLGRRKSRLVADLKTDTNEVRSRNILICFLTTVPEILCISPASLILQWCKESKSFLLSRKRKPPIHSVNCIVLNNWWTASQSVVILLVMK